jgi:non-specific serine/threonine protein kinase
MLETIRAYGRDLLDEAGEGAAVAARHAAIYTALAARAEPEFYGRDRRVWLDRLADDHDNLRAALAELRVAGDLEGALGMAADLWRFWQLRGHLTEGRQRLDDLLADAASPGARPVSPFVLSRAEEAAGGIRYWTTSDRQIARTFYERSLAHAVESGDRGRVAWATYNLAFVFDFTTEADIGAIDTERGRGLRETALAEFRALGDRRGVAESLWAMGGNALTILDDPEKAHRLLLEALPLLEELGDLYGTSWTLTSLAMLAAVEGDLETAEAQVLRAAALFERDGESAGEIVSLMALGSIAARRGDNVTAVRIAAAAEAAAHAIGAEIPQIPPIVEQLAAAAAKLKPADLAREREIGIALGLRSLLSAGLGSQRANRSSAETGSGQRLS